MLGTTVLIANTIVPQMGGDPVCFFFWIRLSNILWDYMVVKSTVWYCDWKQGDKARVIQTILFMSGINTLLQTLIGTRLPTVMGVSFAYVLPVLSIIRDYNDGQFINEKQVKTRFYISVLLLLHFLVFYTWQMLLPFLSGYSLIICIGCLQRFRHTIRTVQGSLIISSFVNIIIGYSQAWGNLIRWYRLNVKILLVQKLMKVSNI